MHTFPQQHRDALVATHDILDVDIDEEDYVDTDGEDDNDFPTSEYDDDRSGGDIGSYINEHPVPTGLEHAPDNQNISSSGQHQDNIINNNNRRSGNTNIEECTPILSHPIFDHDENASMQEVSLQFVASNDSQPATYSKESLANVVHQIVSTSCEHEESNLDDGGNLIGGSNTTRSTTNTSPTSSDTSTTSIAGQKILIMQGYCKWRAFQLEREIQRESWSVCVDGTVDDVLRHHDSGFWQEISSDSDRLMTWQQLVESYSDNDVGR